MRDGDIRLRNMARDLALRNEPQALLPYLEDAMREDGDADLRNAAMAMESYYGENLAYPNNETALLLVGYRKTTGVTLTINITSPSTYTLTAARPSGSQPSFTFDSNTGLIN